MLVLWSGDGKYRRGIETERRGMGEVGRRREDGEEEIGWRLPGGRDTDDCLGLWKGTKV